MSTADATPKTPRPGDKDDDLMASKQIITNEDLSSTKHIVGTEQHDTSNKGSLFVAYLSVFIDMLGLSLIIPIIPFLALRFGADSTALGYIYASYNGAQMISVPITGWLSDKYGRKPMILASLFGSFGGFLIQGLATDLVTFCMGRVVTGIFGGSVPIVNAYIVDTVPAAARPRYFAQLGAVIIVAFMFGPGIGAGLAQFSLQTPMLVACGIAGVGFIIALVTFKEPPKKDTETTESKRAEESKPAESKTGQVGEDIESKADLGTDLKTDSRPEYYWPIAIMYTAAFLFNLAFSGYIYYVGLLLFDLYGWEALEYGFVAMGASVWMVLNQMSTFVVFQKKFGKHATLAVGSVVMAVGMLLISFWTGDVRSFSGVPLVVISIAILAFGVSFVQPSVTAITSRYASQSEQGSVLGRSQAIRSLGNTLGPLIWGIIYSADWRLVYILCAVLSLIITVLSLLLLRMNRKLPEHTKKPSEKGAIELSDMKVHIPEGSDEATHLRRENVILRSKLKKYISHHRTEVISPDMEEALEQNVHPNHLTA